MAEARLGPEELDRLEDALEGLEDLDDLGDPSPGVSARLADFKLILEASREALPLEDVPSGLLDGVLAEARMSAEDIQTPSPPREAEGFWARLRRAWLVPGLAVAGSAALVLILLQPTMSSEPEQAASEAVAVKDASTPTSQSAAAPAGDAMAKEELAEEEEEVPEAVLEESAASAPPPPAAAPASPRAAAEKAVPATDAPVPAVTPTPEPAVPAEPEAKQDDAGNGWNAVEDGDTARKGGDCFTARNHYARALDDGNDSVRARAYVGMGLCKREEGNEAAASEYFTKARELDEDAVEFAETQNKKRSKRPRSRAPSKKASGKRKKSMNLDEVNDPLSGL